MDDELPVPPVRDPQPTSVNTFLENIQPVQSVGDFKAPRAVLPRSTGGAHALRPWP